MQLIAKTLQGLEDVLAEELVGIGANGIEMGRRMVSFEGDKEMMYKANFHLRTALRILMPIARFKAKDAEEVYEGVKRINWKNYFDVKQSFCIDTTIYSDTFRNSQFLTYKVKDGIVDHFREKYDERPSVRLTSADIYINVHIAQNDCTVSLDSSGESLHKRGYRKVQTEAPLNEVLAAGMILKTGWRGDKDLVDPMCGSGTILIEAAMIALNIPGGIYRQGFAFERWKDYDADLYDTIYNDESCEREFTHKIYGSDISARAIQIAEENIKNAGLSKYIDLTVQSISAVEEVPANGVLVTNPPYGERISTSDILGLYDILGQKLKHIYKGYDAWVLSYHKECFDKIGLKPSDKIELFNGGLECEYRHYKIFEGRYNEWKAGEGSDEEMTQERSTEERSFDREKGGAERKERFGDQDRKRSFEKRSFEKREGGRDRAFGSDRGEKSFERRERRFDREERDFERRDRRSDREGGDSERRSRFGDRDQKRSFEKREFGNRDRKFGSDRGEKSFEGRERKFDREDRGFQGRERKFDREGGDSERRSRFGDRDQKRSFEKREFGSRDRKFGSDRGEKSFEGRERKFDRGERGSQGRERKFDREVGDSERRSRFGDRDQKRSFEKREFGGRDRAFKPTAEGGERRKRIVHRKNESK